MSSTIKERLSAAKEKLDLLFASTNASERAAVVKDLRDYLSLQNSAAKRPAYDSKTNNATG